MPISVKVEEQENLEPKACEIWEWLNKCPDIYTAAPFLVKGSTDSLHDAIFLVREVIRNGDGYTCEFVTIKPSVKRVAPSIISVNKNSGWKFVKEEVTIRNNL